MKGQNSSTYRESGGAYGTRNASNHMRMVDPEGGIKPAPICTFMMLLVKAAKSLRISMTGAG